MKKTFIIGFMAICVILGLTSCEEKVNDDAVKWKYLAVQFEKNGNWYVVDEMGHEVENAVYPPESQISQVYDGAYWVLLNDTFRLYSVTSPTEPVNGAVYDCVTDFAAGRALVANVGEPIKIINTKGKVKKELTEEYVRVSKFSEDGVAVVDYQQFLSSKKNVINRKGKNLLSDLDSYGLETIFPSHDGAMLSIDTLEGKFKIFDLKGQELCRLSPLEYQTDEIRRLRPDYNEGFLCLRMRENRDMLGYVDKQGQLQFTVKSYSGSNDSGFRDGYAVINNNSETIIDKTGNVVFEAPYRRWYWVINVGNGRFAGIWEDSSLHVDVFDTQGNVLFTMDGFNDYNKCTFGDKFLLQHDGYHLYDAQGNLLNEKPFYAVSDYRCPEFVDYLDVQEADLW